LRWKRADLKNGINVSALASIRGFLLLPEGTGTSGMPRPEHFPNIAGAGYRTVINLALPTSDLAIPNEGELVVREGMTYIHIPVLFDNPQREDYDRFERLMNALIGSPVFVHCAANMRVSAFMFLYRVRSGIANRTDAETSLRKIWDPDPTWRKYINSILPPKQRPL
jgi:protein tyrosine phosphatase (PTP) superfamily phosphohydrolase (DUF442 family)